MNKMNSFTDANGVKTYVGDMVTYTGNWFGEEISSMFQVVAIDRYGRRVSVELNNQQYGTFGTNRKNLINEM